VLAAATGVGFIREVKVLDANGLPTGQMKPEWDGDGGLAGYLEWAAVFQPGHFITQLGRVMPIQVNAITRTETKAVVRYETVAERRAAMIERGWPPSVLQAMEDALEPKFLQDLRAEKKAKAIEAVVVESGGDDIEVRR
jgi:hypothetical protein